MPRGRWRVDERDGNMVYYVLVMQEKRYNGLGRPRQKCRGRLVLLGKHGSFTQRRWCNHPEKMVERKCVYGRESACLWESNSLVYKKQGVGFKKPRSCFLQTYSLLSLAHSQTRPLSCRGETILSASGDLFHTKKNIRRYYK